MHCALKFWLYLWRVGPQHRQDPQTCYCWTLSSLSSLFPCLIQHFLLSHAHSPFCPHYRSFLACSHSDQKGPKRLILALRPGELGLRLFCHIFIIHWMSPVHRLLLWTPERIPVLLTAVCEESADPACASPRTAIIKKLMIEVELMRHVYSN